MHFNPLRGYVSYACECMHIRSKLLIGKERGYFFYYINYYILFLYYYYILFCIICYYFVLTILYQSCFQSF